MMSYVEFFRRAFGKESDEDFRPFEYQRRLAEEPWPDLLDVPTRLGKQLYERVVTLAAHWSDVGTRRDKAVEAYNKSVATLESRVLVSARRFRELEAAPEGIEIEVAAPIDHTARVLQAPGLASMPSNGNAQ